MRALLFPGQGAQYAGMGKAFFAGAEEARSLFLRADQVLGFELSRLCFDGPADQLEATDICQPAILVTSLAITEVLKRRQGLAPAQFKAVLGLSLGEYTALCFAGALSFEDAVRLVRERGLAMQEASMLEPSGMLSVLNASDDQLERLVAEGAKAGVLVAANYLAPGQVALSGALPAIERAESVAKQIGIRRAVRLKVAGAFHSPLMESAAHRLQAALDRVTIERPSVPVIANVSAEPVTEPAAIAELLARQLTSPVRWSQSIGALLAQGTRTFVEPGPGRVLTNLVARQAGQPVTTFSIDSMADVAAYQAAANAAAS
ncbi:MAG: ACP S-malonyltransferase [Planctomycetota bacterium]